MRNPELKRACQRRYERSAKGKATQGRYDKSAKGKTRTKKYLQSAEGQIMRSFIDQRPDVLLRKRLYMQAYRDGHI